MDRIKTMALRKTVNLLSSLEVERMVDNAHQASDLLKALSQESRLLILCLLSQGEKSVGELEEFLSLKQSTVSQQLARLRLEGLVASRRDGQAIYYSLASDDVALVLDALYEIFCDRKAKHRR